MQPYLIVDLLQQCLMVYQADQRELCRYPVSTAANGAGERQGSQQTPRGIHVIRAIIGHGMPWGAVFTGRRPTGEIWSPALAVQYPQRDWILSRILWLSGCEVGKNRLGSVDTMRRYIYIHGTGEDQPMGVARSHGCIRMRNDDVIALSRYLSPGVVVNIKENHVVT